MPSDRPKASSDEARRRMERQKGRDTKPERSLRSALHRRGLRFRVDQSILPDTRRRADVIFPRSKVAVFVDGCFWHGCPTHRTYPRANAEWWKAKIDANVERDRDTDRRLEAKDWLVIRVWEHQDLDVAASRIAKVVRQRSQ
jgi:DNA mismatch endonuclease (patch repair protein)